APQNPAGAYAGFQPPGYNASGQTGGVAGAAGNVAGAAGAGFAALVNAAAQLFGGSSGGVAAPAEAQATVDALRQIYGDPSTGQLPGDTSAPSSTDTPAYFYPSE